MSDAPFIISPAGFITDVNFDPAGPQNGFANISPGKSPSGTPNTGRGPWDVTTPLPQAFLANRGTGQTNLLTGQLVGGFRGTIQADFVTGTAAPAQAIATVIGNFPVTLFLGICIDSSNRPFFRITDFGGTLVAFSTPSGSAIPAGVPMSVRFAWDANAKILAGYALLKIGSTVIASSSYTLPSSGWTPFNPTAVLAGVGGYNSLNDFGGQIIKVQVSSVPITA